MAAESTAPAARVKTIDGLARRPRRIGQTTGERYVRSSAARPQPAPVAVAAISHPGQPMSAETRAGFEALLAELTGE